MLYVLMSYIDYLWNKLHSYNLLLILLTIFFILVWFNSKCFILRLRMKQIPIFLVNFADLNDSDCYVHILDIL